jgi:hypothetical protein
VAKGERGKVESSRGVCNNQLHDGTDDTSGTFIEDARVPEGTLPC